MKPPIQYHCHHPDLQKPILGLMASCRFRHQTHLGLNQGLWYLWFARGTWAGTHSRNRQSNRTSYQSNAHQRGTFGRELITNPGPWLELSQGSIRWERTRSIHRRSHCHTGSLHYTICSYRPSRLPSWGAGAISHCNHRSVGRLAGPTCCKGSYHQSLPVSLSPWIGAWPNIFQWVRRWESHFPVGKFSTKWPPSSQHLWWLGL